MLKLRIYTDSIPCIMSSFILMCNISLSELSAALLPGRLMKSTQLKLLPEEYSDWFNFIFNIILFLNYIYCD